MAIRRMSSRTNPNGMSRNDSSLDAANGVAPKRGMILPFTPLAMSFDTVNYYVDMPPVRSLFYCLQLLFLHQYAYRQKEKQNKDINLIIVTIEHHLKIKYLNRK